jgi:hypothetical protein
VKHKHNKNEVLNSLVFVYDVEIKLISNLVDFDILLQKITEALQNAFAALAYHVVLLSSDGACFINK